MAATPTMVGVAIGATVTRDSERVARLAMPMSTPPAIAAAPPVPNKTPEATESLFAADSLDGSNASPALAALLIESYA
jgi:hypothetical protein